MFKHVRRGAKRLTCAACALLPKVELRADRAHSKPAPPARIHVSNLTLPGRSRCINMSASSFAMHGWRAELALRHTLWHSQLSFQVLITERFDADSVRGGMGLLTVGRAAQLTM